MIIRINREEKRVILDSGSTQETFWYDTLSYGEAEIEIKRNNTPFMLSHITTVLSYTKTQSNYA